mmetsp:Transcript_128120/g.332203  ORF Transcript_128120/g.332203 Transcript_128120/m.332203 type:complete len:511 (-) Transcript_128120:178-1710(-)|eukprot:CAMPEP_0115598270 /NCGR_PEP_ID=MMETSP0272-20121206/13788_1 /TAXON_ID=71861 /ORGANISM="Scrippsiella trochoidea, Strain CCMP3099" /LENGTH=510 /DNA_ID=CAMNT_0003033681 /DNA_START=17 /DNA_END=1549 /DNA_ORIENTATION=-
MRARRSAHKFAMNACAEGITSALRIFILALAIEVLYMVPYGLTASFRPLLLETFNLSNRDVAQMSSAYGIVSMCFYLPGGYVADRFQPKLLMVVALLTTAACCFYLTTGPSVNELILVWALLAVAGTLLFWSSFVAAIRQIGGEEHSGKAFGFEQLSRGIVSSLMTLALAAWMRQQVPAQMVIAPSAKKEAMAMLLRRLAMLEVAMAGMIMLALPSGKASLADAERIDDNESSHVCQETTKGASVILAILKRPAVWLHALIVVAAYSGNLATSYFSGLATYGYGMDVVQAAEISTLVTCMRAWAGLLAGLAADRFGRSKICCGMFLAYSCAYFWVALMPVDPHQTGILMVQIAASAASVYAIAGVYFTLLDDAKLPLELTGSAVGAISVIGFTPDIFMGQISALFLDNYPGARGYQYFYFTMAFIGLSGFLVTIAFSLVVKKHAETGSTPQQVSGSNLPSASCTDSTSAPTTESSASSVSESTSILSSETTDIPSQRTKKAPYGGAVVHD